MNFILFKNTRIHFSDHGTGNAVVFLHGFLENSVMWNSYVEVFSKYHRVITIDLLGHGQTECLGYVHTMEDNADAVNAVLNHLRIRRAVFVGHSMGGYVALAIAEIYPGLVKAIALINSTSKGDNEQRRQNRDRAINAVKENHTNFVRMSIANLFSPDNREKFADEIEYVKKQALNTPLQGIVASLEGMKVRDDRTSLLEKPTFPVLVVLGKKDPVLDFDENQSLFGGLSVQLETLPDGHMSPVENLYELTAILDAFFKIR